MRITMTADLHGHFPSTPGGDLLIVAGDMVAHGHLYEWMAFYKWLEAQEYAKKVYVAGNHDNFLKQRAILKEATEIGIPDDIADYLCDSGTFYSTEMEDGKWGPYYVNPLKIWGTSWTPWFVGISSQCKAFTGNEYALDNKFALIPDDTDILISHGPPRGILDYSDPYMEELGSTALRKHLERVMPKLFVCGHIHEGFGFLDFKGNGPNTMCYNVAHMDEHYRPMNEPVTIDL